MKTIIFFLFILNCRIVFSQESASDSICNLRQGLRSCQTPQLLSTIINSKLIEAETLKNEFSKIFEAKLNSDILSRIANEANKVKSTVSTSSCWGAVFQQLVNSKTLKECRGIKAGCGDKFSVDAKDAVTFLKDKNFVNLLDSGQVMSGMKNPCYAPKGAVLVYEGGPFLSNAKCGKNGKERCGHTEIKLGEVGMGAVASDYRSPSPITGCSEQGPNHFKSSDQLKLIGIMVPGEAIR